MASVAFIGDFFSRNYQMTRFYLITRFCLLLLLVAIAFDFKRPVNAQSLQLKDLPGWDRVEQASADAAKIPVARLSDFRWMPDALYFKKARDTYFRIDFATGEMTKVAAADVPEAAPTAQGPKQGRRPSAQRARQREWVQSSDAKWKASFRDYNIVLESLDEKQKPVGEPIQVTTAGSEKHRYGTACWVYGEELDQNDAMWFSPDNQKLAFYEIDEGHMKTYFLTTRNTRLYTGLHKEQYPTAGEDNPHVALHIFDLDSRKTVKVKVDGPIDQYIYNVRFSADGKQLLFHRTNRWQNELELMAADVATGDTTVVVAEKQDTWQENSPLMRFLEDGQTFIWETERSGWKQFQLRNLKGEKICDLTPEVAYPVQDIVLLDEEHGWLYYTAYSDDNPLNLHLHRTRLDGTGQQKLTSGDFTFSGFEIAPTHDKFTAQYETISTPPATGLWKMSETTSDKMAVLAAVPAEALKDAGFVPGELFSFKASDNKTDIYGTLYKPRNFDPNKQYPLLVDVYGGPHSVGVTNRFRAMQPYCELGFVIAKIGNRGTINRGKAFESANYLKLGLVDMDDQADGVKFLRKRDYIDGERVGISGHSYGGYMSALALLRYPNIFHVGVAGAPVTHWKNYDTIYTERYMRTPAENKAGYERGSCMAYADQLQGKLFILHGLVDDNVHPSNTWQLVKALQDAGKRFDLMVYPNSAHGFRYGSLKWDYFVRHLKPESADGQAEAEQN